jgi:hypothetical protein
MPLPRHVRHAVTALLLACCACGCRSTNGFFQIDSNSRTPWFGLAVPLSRDKAGRKTLETIGQSGEHEAQIVPAAEQSTEKKPAAKKSPSLISHLLGTEESPPLPEDTAAKDDESVVVLEGPREAFP